MWGRVVEIMLALWLLLSPFIFRHDPEAWGLWASDLASAMAILVLAGLSFWPPTRYAHLLILGVGAWLVGFGYVQSIEATAPGYQNQILVGLTLILIAIIPNHANQLPPSWRRYYQRKAEAQESSRREA